MINHLMAIHHTFPIASNPLSKNNKQDINMNSNPKTVNPAPISNNNNKKKLRRRKRKSGNDNNVIEKGRKVKTTLYICQPDHNTQGSIMLMT